MLKYILTATLIVYIIMLFIPNFKVTINDRPTDNIFWRIFGAAVFAILFFVAIGLPIYAVSTLF